MSNETDKIRDMVYALMRGDTETARQASTEVMASKTARMVEMNDTGSDSAVVKGSHDADQDDNTERKGSVSAAGKIDHKEYSGDKPNVYDKKDAVDAKPVNEDADDVVVEDGPTDDPFVIALRKQGEARIAGMVQDSRGSHLLSDEAQQQILRAIVRADNRMIGKREMMDTIRDILAHAEAE